MQPTATVVLDLPAASSDVCCNEARICSSCGKMICFEHDDPAPVTCEVVGVVCPLCHENCASVPCAREHADPDLWR